MPEVIVNTSSLVCITTRFSDRRSVYLDRRTGLALSGAFHIAKNRHRVDKPGAAAYNANATAHPLAGLGATFRPKVPPGGRSDRFGGCF